MVSFKKANSRLVFKDGKLYQFGESSVLVYRPSTGPKVFPALFKKTAEKGWHCFQPNLGFPYITENLFLSHLDAASNPSMLTTTMYKLIALEKIKHTIDSETLKTIRSFAKHDHYSIEKFLWSVGETFGRNYILQSPAISYMLANLNYFHPLKSRRYNDVRRRLVFKKRKDILEYLGFPRSESLARSLDRITKKSLSREMLLTLRKQVWQDSGIIRRLAFIPTKIRGGAVSLLLGDFSNQISDNLIFDVARDVSQSRKAHTYFAIRDIMRTSEALKDHDISHPNWKNQIFQTTSDVWEFHDELVFLLNEASLHEKNLEYPQHPYLKNVDNFFLKANQIKSQVSLFKEGTEQEHCIYSYNRSLLCKENLFVYSIERPERLTALLEYHPRWGTRIIQVRGKCNKQPMPHSIEFLKDWLEEENWNHEYKYPAAKL